MKKKLVKHFTLIEVMIVLAIIGIIAGIGVPQFMKYRDSAYSKKRLLNIETFKTSCEAYKINYDIVNPDDVNWQWTNSKGVALKANAVSRGFATSSLDLNLLPFHTNDQGLDDAILSVYDFVKNGRAGLKVGKSVFCPLYNTHFATGEAAPAGGRRTTTPNRKPYRYIDFALWLDAESNLAANSTGIGQFYHDVENSTITATYSNSTGKMIAGPNFTAANSDAANALGQNCNHD